MGREWNVSALVLWIGLGFHSQCDHDVVPPRLSAYVFSGFVDGASVKMALGTRGAAAHMSDRRLSTAAGSASRRFNAARPDRKASRSPWTPLDGTPKARRKAASDSQFATPDWRHAPRESTTLKILMILFTARELPLPFCLRSPPRAQPPWHALLDQFLA